MKMKRKKNKKTQLTPQELLKIEDKNTRKYYISVGLNSMQINDEGLEDKIWFLLEIIKNYDNILTNTAIKKLQDFAQNQKFAKHILLKIKDIDADKITELSRRNFDDLVEYLQLRAENKCKCEAPYLYKYPQDEATIEIISDRNLIKTDKNRVEYYEALVQCTICGRQWLVEESIDYEIKNVKWTPKT